MTIHKELRFSLNFDSVEQRDDVFRRALELSTPRARVSATEYILRLIRADLKKHAKKKGNG